MRLLVVSLSAVRRAAADLLPAAAVWTARAALIALVWLAVPSCGAVAQPGMSAPPAVRREFRGAWIATVANIDWPSRPGLDVWQQQLELLQLLNRAVALHLNAVILQVRPAGDALYATALEPWSSYLTGRMGLPPEPSYDPLAFAVAEAHRRGLELHAWFNPYRAHHPSDSSPVAATHLSRARPEIVRAYGRSGWMDPGEPAVQAHSLRVALDVVRRYDIDGVHVDDYFYPYKERDSAGRVLDFPDEPSWQRYARGGGTLSRDDWRRRNVDQFIERLYHGIKHVKPWVKFGVSPFGIWRPGFPAQVTGFDAYAELYADSRRWLREGWVDYFAPQLYWPIAQTAQSYPVLLRWWTEQNVRGRHLWPGNFTSRTLAAGVRPPQWSPRELLDQIEVTRQQPGASGNIHFSMKAFMPSPNELADRLTSGPYAEPALVPPSPWLGARRPGAPRVRRYTDAATGLPAVSVRPGPGARAWLWVVQTRFDTSWTTVILPATERQHVLAAPRAPQAPLPSAIAVSAVTRTGVQGPAVVLALPTSRDSTPPVRPGSASPP